MPYGRPVIKSISQNYQEAEVTPSHLSQTLSHLSFSLSQPSQPASQPPHSLSLFTFTLFIKERDVLLSCEVEALGENLVIWKQGDRTISAGSIMVSHNCSYVVIIGRTWSYLVILGHTWPYLVTFSPTWSYMVIWKQGDCTISVFITDLK